MADLFSGLIKRIIPIALLALALSGCEKSEPAEKNISLQDTSISSQEENSSSAQTDNSEDNTSSSISEDKITPYQYLNLMVGNAEDFTFSYKFEGETTHFCLCIQSKGYERQFTYYP